jgi:hypothetical protein
MMISKGFTDKLIAECGGEPWTRAPMRAITGTAFTPEGLNKLIKMVASECALYCKEIAESDDNQGEYSEGAMQSHFKIAALFALNADDIGRPSNAKIAAPMQAKLPESSQE